MYFQYHFLFSTISFNCIPWAIPIPIATNIKETNPLNLKRVIRRNKNKIPTKTIAKGIFII